MRLRNIHSFEAADSFLQEQFLPNYWNKNLTVLPENLDDEFKEVPHYLNVDEVLCIKELRQVASDHTISYKGEKFLIESPLKYSIYKQQIEIRTYVSGERKCFFADRELVVKKVKTSTRAGSNLAA